MNMNVQLGAGGNDFNASMDFTQTFTADNATAAAVSTVALVRGSGKESSNALPTGVTITGGDHDNYNELQDAFQKTGILLNQLVFDTDNTANYTGVRSLVMYERQFNGRPTKQQKLLLSKFKTSNGNSTDNTLTVTFEKPILVTPRTVIEFDLLKNSSMTVTGFYSFEEVLRSIARTVEQQ